MMTFNCVSSDQVESLSLESFQRDDISNPTRKGSDGKYYFWNETWCDLYGPYLSRVEVDEALSAYAKTL